MRPRRSLHHRSRAHFFQLISSRLSYLSDKCIVAIGQAPPLTILAFVIVLLDAVDTVARPTPGARPAVIGMRQLAVTTAFVAVMVVAYLV